MPSGKKEQDGIGQLYYKSTDRELSVESGRRGDLLLQVHRRVKVGPVLWVVGVLPHFRDGRFFGPSSGRSETVVHNVAAPLCSSNGIC